MHRKSLFDTRRRTVRRVGRAGAQARLPSGRPVPLDPVVTKRLASIPHQARFLGRPRPGTFGELGVRRVRRGSAELLPEGGVAAPLASVSRATVGMMASLGGVMTGPPCRRKGPMTALVEARGSAPWSSPSSTTTRRTSCSAAGGGARLSIRSVSGSGWLTAIEAAPILVVTPGQVAWLAKRGLVVGEKTGDRHWRIDDSSARARAAEESRWVSWQQAAAIVRCTETTIHQAARRGEFVRRQVNRRTSSLERQSVEEFGRRWRADQAAVEASNA